LPTIPRAAGSILGRDAELRAALELIDRPDVPLVTLTGPGGIGKTRLAVELARQLGERSRLVELAAIDDPARVLAAIGAAVGADGTEAAIVEALSRQPAVLFLDNFEQVLAAGPTVASLLAAVEDLTVVVTSRAPLRIGGEHELPVPPLPSDSAVELFVRRAREQETEFSPDAGELESIAAICARVDRLPLAIELAAARSRVLTPGEILERIGRRLELLTAGRRDSPERHRTLRATIAWSHDLLAPEEQRLFAQLAVFHGGWSVDAAEAVVDGDVLDALTALVDHALVVRDRRRFGMLETVREYAVERLEESGEAVSTQRRHALWCRSLAEAVGPELEGARQAEAFSRLDVEQENLRAAAAWAVTGGEPEVALGIGGALWRFWLARGAAGEMLGVLNTALATGAGDPVLRATACNAAGILAGATLDLAGAKGWLEEALEIAVGLGDRRLEARALINLGVLANFAGEYVTALEYNARVADIYREFGDLRGQSVAIQNNGVVHLLRGDVDESLPLMEQSLELAQAAHNDVQIASALHTLARLLVFHRLEDPRIPGLLRGSVERAAALGERHLTVMCLEVVAHLAVRKGAAVDAAELIGAVDAERERTGAKRPPDEQPFFEQTLCELVRALGQAEYERAHERGLHKPLDAAVAFALDYTAEQRQAA
jgi:predicted ATPase